MAKCAICDAGAGFAPSKQVINGQEYPLCTTCNMNYMNLGSADRNIKILAVEYFNEKASRTSEAGKAMIDKIAELDESIKQFQEEKQREKERLEYFEAHKYEMMEDLILTTGFSVDGKSVEKYISIISGEAVIGTGFLSEIGAGISDLTGTRSSAFSEKMTSAKEAAIEELKEEAVRKGADAVIGVSFQFITFSSNMIGVSANGTAVILK